jgi:hypothetical protein
MWNQARKHMRSGIRGVFRAFFVKKLLYARQKLARFARIKSSGDCGLANHVRGSDFIFAK